MEQLDRNWQELVQELRVMQTGVQVMAGFLLTLPFQQRFDDLGRGGTLLYLVLAVDAAVATGLMLVPVAVHRRLFRHRVKDVLVKSGNHIAVLALGLVAGLIVGTTALIFSFVVDGTAGWIAGTAIGLSLAAGLLIYPRALWGPQRTRGNIGQ
ncbi:DUF6328 family protein [Arthrobacter psychrolactophilus]|uniref:DUF6328 family protein n=1 Tax=Arthrobacter psychrolactophilus TaxID=92442 RepID=UPI001FEC78C9|nr:DUF6328 family protein [Arthrobacter psychrolactophilus]